MWWHDRRERPGLIRLAAAMAIAATAGACFQPLYGERTLAGGTPLRDLMASVDVVQIAAPNGSPLSRIAVETRNELLFGLTGGSGSAPPTHRLTVALRNSTAILIIDPTSQRNEYENFGLEANYTMVELASNKQVMTGLATTRVTYMTPGFQQRFTKTRAVRDAETRAAKVIADQIRTRLASYFVAGT
jgi:LPS-assembly lipoprotein